MLRKNYLTVFCAVALFLISSVAAFAQTAPIGGQVKLKKADGTLEPVAGALIEIYRLDVKAKFPTDKTDKKGFFNFAGLPLGGTFVIAISAPNTKPGYYPNVKAGMDKIAITVEEGDGKRWTEEEVRSAMTAPPTSGANTQSNANTQKPAEMTAEQKKQQAEYEKQVAEVTEKNKKIEGANKIIDESLKAGNEAFKAKNYDLAISKFDEGYNADPDYAGSAPVLLNNKATALLQRATGNYNQAVKGDAANRATAMEQVKKDFEDVIAASNKSLEILKAAPAGDAAMQKNYEAQKVMATINRKEAYRLMSKTGVDRTKGKETLVAFDEYSAIETDPKKKADAQLALGDALREAGDADNAIVAYRKALETSPDNPDILAGLGLSLFNSGVVSDNKAVKQEGLNYMEKFASIAPDNHPLKASVKDAVEYLKTQDKLTPQKVTKGSAKKN